MSLAGVNGPTVATLLYPGLFSASPRQLQVADISTTSNSQKRLTLNKVPRMQAADALQFHDTNKSFLASIFFISIVVLAPCDRYRRCYIRRMVLLLFVMVELTRQPQPQQHGARVITRLRCHVPHRSSLRLSFLLIGIRTSYFNRVLFARQTFYSKSASTNF